MKLSRREPRRSSQGRQSAMLQRGQPAARLLFGWNAEPSAKPTGLRERPKHEIAIVPKEAASPLERKHARAKTPSSVLVCEHRLPLYRGRDEPGSLRIEATRSRVAAATALGVRTAGWPMVEVAPSAHTPVRRWQTLVRPVGSRWCALLIAYPRLSAAGARSVSNRRSRRSSADGVPIALTMSPGSSIVSPGGCG